MVDVNAILLMFILVSLLMFGVGFYVGFVVMALANMASQNDRGEQGGNIE